MKILIYVLAWVICGVIPSIVAWKQGKQPAMWTDIHKWLLLGPIALIWLVLEFALEIRSGKVDAQVTKRDTQTKNINKDLRICHGCGKQTDKRAKLVTKRKTDILVRSFCSEKCSNKTVEYFSKRNMCIWCEKTVEKESIFYGWWKEPYCSKKCYSEAGKAMATYEVSKGNLI